MCIYVYMPVDTRQVLRLGSSTAVTLPNGMWNKGEELIMVYDDDKVTYMKEEKLARYLNNDKV